MTHAHHFLSRLDRVSLPHVELALSLYRDTKLLHAVLQQARLPDGAERVALSLADPVRGPFIIVTRRGHFVTCLGEGMSPAPHPVVPRAQLDAIACHVHDLRHRMEVAKGLMGPAGGVKRLLARIFEAGDGLSREEFVGISAWQPLLHHDLWRFYLNASVDLGTLGAVLGRITRPRPVEHDLLRHYWRQYWSCGHLLLLATLDRAWELVPDLPESHATTARFLLDGPLALGSTMLTLRGAWAAGRLGKALLPACKQLYLTGADEAEVRAGSHGLIALAVRHSQLRAEARKALAPRRVVPGTPDEAMARWRHTLSTSFCARLDRWVADPDAARADAAEVGRQQNFPLRRAAPAGSPYAFASAEAIPADLALALAARRDGDLFADRTLLGHLFTLLPWSGRAAAEDFYLPADFLPRVEEPWRPARTMALLAAQRRWTARAEPVRVEARPGRNEPCACGSGRKSKRCCGR